MDNTYAVMHNPRRKGNGESSDQEELPPLPPRLYENVFDDPIIAEHDDKVKKGRNGERGAIRNVRPNEMTKHDLNTQLQGLLSQLPRP